MLVLWVLVAFCFIVFFVWLFSMATCPDRIVELFSPSAKETYANVDDDEEAEEGIEMERLAAKTHIPVACGTLPSIREEDEESPTQPVEEAASEKAIIRHSISA